MSQSVQRWNTQSIGEIGLPCTPKIDPTKYPEETFELYSVPSFLSNQAELVKGHSVGSTKQIVQPGDVLLCKIVPHLVRVWCVPSRGVYRQIASGEWIVVRPTSRMVCADYLRYAFIQPNFRKLFMETVSGVGGSLMRARPKAVSQISIPIPPKSEQRQIVARLDSFLVRSGKARAELHRIPRLIERYKQMILDAAFRGELTAEWRKARNLPTFQATTIDSLVQIPIRNGLSVRGSDTPPGVRSLRLSALRTSRVNLDDVRFLPISTDKATKYFLSDGDVLVSRGNGTKAFVGLGALVSGIRENTIFPDTAFRVRLNREKVIAEWFADIWNAPQIRSQIESAAKTTAGIWKISQADLARIQLLLPLVEEQAEIIKRVTSYLSAIEHISLESDRAAHLLERLENSILAKAFRGELLREEVLEAAR